MKTQNLFKRIAILFIFPILTILLAQCTCPPLSTKNPSFTGCWVTEYSHPSSADTSIKGDIIEKEIPIQIIVNSDNTITGNWWTAMNMDSTKGILSGRIDSLNVIRGKWGEEASRDIIFPLSTSGLTFEGTFGPATMWGTTRRFIWNGTKISNCACSETILKNHKAYKSN